MKPNLFRAIAFIARSAFIRRRSRFIARSAFILGGGVLLFPVAAFAQDLTVCTGKGYTLTSAADAAGASPVTYEWYESVNGAAASPIDNSNTPSYSFAEGKSAAGTYAYVRVASNSACTLSSNTYTVEVMAALTVQISNTNVERCGAGEVTLMVCTGGATTPAMTYTWTPAGREPVVTNLPACSFTVNEGVTTYTVTAVNAAGCTSAPATGSITVNPVPTITPSGGAAGQSVNLGTAITPISYTASNATGISWGGNLPTGVTGSISGATLTISGTPSAAGTFGYTVSASHTNGCVSTTTGTITVNTFNSATTWSYGGLTWSDRVVAKPDNCAEVNSLTTSDYTTAEYKIDNSTGVERYYYSWTCATGGADGGTNAQLCSCGWRLPTKSDFDKLVGATNYSTLISEWGYGGVANGSSIYNVDSQAYYWSSTQGSSNTNYAYVVYYHSSNLVGYDTDKYFGFQVRCVK